MAAQPLYGKVVDIEDPKLRSRVRVRIITMTDDESKIATEYLPWYNLKGNRKKHSLPELGEMVEVFLYDGDIHIGTYQRIEAKHVTFADGDYLSGQIIALEDLSEFGDDGILDISYRKSIGLEMTLRESKITLRADGSVSLFNTKSGKYVHVSNESISLGSDTKSAEPGTLGQTNVDVLNMLNDTVTQFRDDMSDTLKDLAKLALGNPRTAHMAKGFTKGAVTIAKLTAKFKENSRRFEDTKSKVVSLD